jgi:hypothetical protein
MLNDKDPPSDFFREGFLFDERNFINKIEAVTVLLLKSNI